MNDNPNARSLAILVRSVGNGAVDGNSSSTDSIGGHNLPHRDSCASPSAVSSTCSAAAVINGEADAYGSSRPSMYTVPRLASSCRMSVAGEPADGTQRRRISVWKNNDIACCTVVIVLPAVRSSPRSAPVNSPCQNGAACGCCRRISSGSPVDSGLATHSNTRSRSPPASAAAWKYDWITFAASVA
ncbi:hypothetical protein GCM10009638_24430 [Luteococcus sanguinis]